MRVKPTAGRSGWQIDVEPQANGSFVLDLTVVENGMAVMGAGTLMTREEIQEMCNKLQAALRLRDGIRPRFGT